MDLPCVRAPTGNHDRIILHFDYDCFYAQVVEKQQPALKSLPLGIKQKAILATCNYEARRRGVTKLMLIAEARKLCPELVLADGEDLTAFRDVSKALYGLLRTYSWNLKLERLGLDEVFMDVTDIVAYNVELLNRNALEKSFFCLSRQEPARGFPYDARIVAGSSHGKVLSVDERLNKPLYVRLLVASHFARYLRLQIEEEGFTSSCGIATNKVLAKLVGTKDKPRNQTALLALDDEDVRFFMDAHTILSIPGIGPRIRRVLENHLDTEPILGQSEESRPALTVGRVRSHFKASVSLLDELLSGPGSGKDMGTKIWNLLHGIDNSDVKPARDIPTQISIEDTYQGLNQATEIDQALRLICHSLLRRIKADLLDPVHQTWLAQPHTIRLTTRPKTSDRPYNWARACRSASLPAWALRLDAPMDQVAARLVDETLVPLFRALHPSPGHWKIGLLNVCMTNIIPVAATGDAMERDIADMFRRQQDVLREFTAYEEQKSTTASSWTEDKAVIGQAETEVESSFEDVGGLEDGSEEIDDDGAWDEDEAEMAERCLACGRLILSFALAAHSRFHDLEDG